MGDATPPWKSYEEHLDQECLRSLNGSLNGSQALGKPDTMDQEASLKVGIVGGGMAGLYSALLLRKHIPGVKVKVFEANSRVGGRVYTHKFSSEPYQYFDTGAMRIPKADCHKPVLTLIEYLNRAIPDDPIKLVDFIGSCPEGNRVFFNGSKIMSVQYANEHCSELGFPKEAEAVDGSTPAAKLLNDALKTVHDILEADFSTAVKKYSNISLFDYLSRDLGWSTQKIRYVEAMTGHTNEFQRDIVFEILLRRSYGTNKTIEGGMSLLPERCADVLLKKNVEIALNSKVEAIEEIGGGSVRIGYKTPCKDLTFESFDAIILTIPPPVIRMIPQRPKWGSDLEQALRTIFFRGSTKVIVRFKSRFWERTDLQLPPSLGGVSTTDLPIREVRYPSYGIGDKGKGLLCAYTKGHDSEMFNLFSEVEQVKLVLSNLQLLYPEIDITEEYAGGKDPEDTEKFLKEAYVKEWPFAAGILYYPGDFLSLYPTLVAPRGHVYFAGSHLSPNSFWILGALESAKRAVQQLVLKQCRLAESVTYIT